MQARGPSVAAEHPSAPGAHADPGGHRWEWHHNQGPRPCSTARVTPVQNCMPPHVGRGCLGCATQAGAPSRLREGNLRAPITGSTGSEHAGELLVLENSGSAGAPFTPLLPHLVCMLSHSGGGSFGSVTQVGSPPGRAPSPLILVCVLSHAGRGSCGSATQAGSPSRAGGGKTASGTHISESAAGT